MATESTTREFRFACLRWREVKILMRLSDGRNVAARQAVHGSAPCVRTEVTGRWLGTAVDSPCLDDLTLPRKSGQVDYLA